MDTSNNIESQSQGDPHTWRLSEVLDDMVHSMEAAAPVNVPGAGGKSGVADLRRKFEEGGSEQHGDVPVSPRNTSLASPRNNSQPLPPQSQQQQQSPLRMSASNVAESANTDNTPLALGSPPAQRFSPSPVSPRNATDASSIASRVPVSPRTVSSSNGNGNGNGFENDRDERDKIPLSSPRNNNAPSSPRRTHSSSSPSTPPPSRSAQSPVPLPPVQQAKSSVPRVGPELPVQPLRLLLVIGVCAAVAFFISFIGYLPAVPLLPHFLASLEIVRWFGFIPFSLSTCLGMGLIAIGVALRFRAMTFSRISTQLESLDVHFRQLLTSDVFSLSRNPSYLGFALIGAGLAFVLNSAYLLVGIATWTAIIHFVVIPVEEDYQRDKFGESFDRYASETARWISLQKLAIF